jgi:DNA-binding winged helix-turn-helix (wHTH) protein/TolB-like protein/Flp pilus assembly protein TadD
MSLENVPDLFLNISDTDVKPEENHFYRFKSFTLKPVERQLFDDDRRVSLTPKAFDILTFLIVNAGHLVTKEQLFETIWAESFVEEANLSRLVHTIRKTLHEDENGNKFIETVPTKGYRFVAEVEQVTITPRENTETFATDSAEEFSPDGLESSASIHSQQVPMPMGDEKSPSRWLFAGLAIVVVVGFITSFAVWRNNTGLTAAKSDRISIAVLPFRPINTGERNLTSDLAFANAVITYLNESKNLSVRPFALMRKYTDVTQDPITIGNEREADYVLESIYIAHGGRLQVTANLFNVKTGAVDETLKYEGDGTDLYTLGQTVASKIVPDLLAKLNLAEVDRGTENEEAWRSYLQGMILSNKRTVEDGEKAVGEFNNALKLDPNYAMAYMGLAHALQTILINGGDREKLCSPAREAEIKALELDPNSGDALVMLATNRRYCDWDIAGGEGEYRRAVELSPDSAHVRRFYAINIATIEGRFDEALEHLRIAQELDPHNPFNVKLFGRVYFYARRYDEAIVQSIKAKDLVPEPEQTSFVYMSYEMKGDLEKAFEWFCVVKSLEGESEENLNSWQEIYTESGWQGVLRRRLERALDAEKTADNVNKRARLLEEITTLSVQLDDYDRAFEYMNKAIDAYVLFGGQFLTNPYLDPIRSDPRYKAILARTWNRYGGNYGVF